MYFNQAIIIPESIEGQGSVYHVLSQLFIRSDNRSRPFPSLGQTRPFAWSWYSTLIIHRWALQTLSLFPYIDLHSLVLAVHASPLPLSLPTPYTLTSVFSSPYFCRPVPSHVSPAILFVPSSFSHIHHAPTYTFPTPRHTSHVSSNTTPSSRPTKPSPRLTSTSYTHLAPRPPTSPAL